MEASSSYLGARLWRGWLVIGVFPFAGRRRYLRFAVAAPWGVKFYKNVFFVVNNDILVVVGYHNLNIALLLLGNGLGLDAGFELASHEIIDELANVFRRELLGLVKGKLLVLDGLLDRKGRPFVGFEVEILGVGAKGFSVDGGEADDTLVFLSDGLEGLR